MTHYIKIPTERLPRCLKCNEHIGLESFTGAEGTVLLHFKCEKCDKYVTQKSTYCFERDD